MPLLTLKGAKGLKTQKTRLKLSKKKLVPFLSLKGAKGLKTSYGEIFGKLLVFFDPKNHFLLILATKTQKKKLELSKKNLCRF